MKLGRRHAETSKPLVLPAPSETVTLIAAGGQKIPARVLECAPDSLLVAITVPTGPLSDRQLEGLVLEFVGPRGRVRVSGSALVQDASEPDLLRIIGPRSVELLQERDNVRIQSARPVVVYGPADWRQVESYTIDLSGGGFLLAGPDFLQIGDEVQFQLTLTPGELPVVGAGTVVRVDGRGRRAIAFSRISDLDRRRVVRFIFRCQRTERQRGWEMQDDRGD